jgi:hypothetical protein
VARFEGVSCARCGTELGLASVEQSVTVDLFCEECAGEECTECDGRFDEGDLVVFECGSRLCSDCLDVAATASEALAWIEQGMDETDLAGLLTFEATARESDRRAGMIVWLAGTIAFRIVAEKVIEVGPGSFVVPGEATRTVQEVTSES